MLSPEIIHRGNQLARGFATAWLDDDVQLKGDAQLAIVDEVLADRPLLWATLAGFSRLTEVLLERIDTLTGDPPHEILALIAQHWEQGG